MFSRLNQQVSLKTPLRRGFFVRSCIGVLPGNEWRFPPVETPKVKLFNRSSAMRVYTCCVMNTQLAAKTIGLFVLGFVLSTIVTAAEIYHWVDENGVSHYSQYKPASDTPGVSTQKMETSRPSGDGQAEDVYHLEAHEKRMTAWREQRQKERDESRDRKRQDSQQLQIQYPQSQSSYRGRRGFYNYRPPNHPRPPIVKPRPASILPNPPSL